MNEEESTFRRISRVPLPTHALGLRIKIARDRLLASTHSLQVHMKYESVIREVKVQRD